MKKSDKAQGGDVKGAALIKPRETRAGKAVPQLHNRTLNSAKNTWRCVFERLAGPQAADPLCSHPQDLSDYFYRIRKVQSYKLSFS